jgi:hypothetical protein
LKQQCDVILKLEHFQLQILLVTPYDKTFLIGWICEDLQKHPLVIDIGSSLKNQN